MKCVFMSWKKMSAPQQNLDTTARLGINMEPCLAFHHGTAGLVNVVVVVIVVVQMKVSMINS